MTRTGKIARLPHALRDELNHRLDDNIPGREITAWLNGLPEVQAILSAHFGADPINQQNLSNWRRGGFLEWQTRRDFFDRLQDLTDSATDLDSTLPANLTEHATRLLTAHIALLLSPSPGGAFNALWSTDVPSSPSAPSSTRTVSNDPSSLLLVKPLCALTRAISTIRRDDLAVTRHSPATTEAAAPEAAPAAASPLPDIPPASPPAPSPEPAIKPVKASSSLVVTLAASPCPTGSSLRDSQTALLKNLRRLSVVKPRTFHPDPRVSPALPADRRIIPALAKA